MKLLFIFLLLPFATGLESDRCSLKIVLDKDVFVSGEPISIMTSQNTTSIIWVEDLFGGIVRPAYADVEHSWTPQIGGRMNAFIIKARAEGCRGYSARMVGVVNGSDNVPHDAPEELPDNTSSAISIEDVKVTDDTAIVKLHAFRAGTAKYSVQVYATSAGKRVSSIQKLNLKDKGTAADLTIYIQIGGCGAGEIFAEGLGLNDSFPYEVACPDKDGALKEAHESDQSSLKSAKPIKSFYTLAKKFSEIITLYANIDADNCTIVLDTSNGSITKRAEDGKNAFNVSAVPGRNLFIISVLKENITIDKETLVVDLETATSAIEKTYSNFSQVSVVRQGLDERNETASPNYALIALLIAIIPLGIIVYRRFR